MGIKPILFNTEMVRAIQDGRKSVTRRVVKLQPEAAFRYFHEANDGEWFWTTQNRDDDMMGWWPSYEHGIKPPYQPGDILYVQEAWKGLCSWVKGVACPRYGYAVKFKDGEEIEFYFDNADRAKKWQKYLDKPKWHWQSPYFMPREAARIFLRVTGVRVERLQQPFFDQGSTIFELQREGVDIGSQCRECIYTYGRPCCIDDESECGILDDVRDNFSCIWDSTINPADLDRYGWVANPWVWVVEFERCEKPMDFLTTK